MLTLSMKSRIGLCIGAVVALVLILLSVVAHYEFKEALMRTLDYRLQTDAQTIFQILMTDKLYTEDAEREILAILDSRAGTQRLGYAIWEEGMPEWLQKAEPLDVKEWISHRGDLRPSEQGFSIAAVEQSPLRARLIWACSRVPTEQEDSGARVNVVMAISSEYLYHETAEFVRLLVISGTVLLAVSAVFLYGIFRWGFRPIEVLKERMEQISGKNVSRVSLDFPPMPLELRPFVKAWQEMLQKLAEGIEEQKRFLSDAAHELRTPLALMKSSLQLAQSQPRTTGFYEQTIRQVLEDLDRLNRLIQQMLELSRLESLPARLEWEPLDLGQLLEEIVDSFTEYARERGFSLVYQRGAARVFGHPEQLRRLFSNLLENAVQYGPAGTPITVRLETDNRVIRVHVHDEGGQIPPEDCAHLFDRFYRVHKARDRNSGGTGLGLSIANEIAVLHGGQIVVQSNPQEGTTFTVQLPKAEDF